MTDVERHLALAGRIDTLERHARSLEAAFTADTFKAEVGELLAVLRGASAALAVAQDAAALAAVEHMVDAASLLLASLGRVP